MGILKKYDNGNGSNLDYVFPTPSNPVDILKKYDSGNGSNLDYIPPTPPNPTSGRRGEVEVAPDQFQSDLSPNDSELAVEDGKTFNQGYSTKVGSEVKSFSTTQPYTPRNTYIDSLQDEELIRRARDPFK